MVKQQCLFGTLLSIKVPGRHFLVPESWRKGVKMTEPNRQSEASSVACWVYVQKYVKQKTLDEMLQKLPGAGQFIIVMNTWFERLMAEE